jgi:hypothetical protein
MSDEVFRLALLHAVLSRRAGRGTRPLHRILETLRHEPADLDADAALQEEALNSAAVLCSRQLVH